MSSFDKRRDSFEKKFSLDEEQKFKARVRRNKLLGLWAAEKMGLSGAEAAEYAKEVIKADFSQPGDEGVFAKVSEDFAAKGVEQSEHQIRRTMDELLGHRCRTDPERVRGRVVPDRPGWGAVAAQVSSLWRNEVFDEGSIGGETG
jgi:hypothetical protein